MFRYMHSVVQLPQIARNMSPRTIRPPTHSSKPLTCEYVVPKRTVDDVVVYLKAVPHVVVRRKGRGVVEPKSQKCEEEEEGRTSRMGAASEEQHDAKKSTLNEAKLRVQ